MDLIRFAKRLKIPHFRGVFSRNTLPTNSHCNESAIVNLDLVENSGTHWVAYRKRGRKVEYFDSFGALKPPEELVRYLRGCEIMYNNKCFQDFNQINCGHLCLKFLYEENI